MHQTKLKLDGIRIAVMLITCLLCHRGEIRSSSELDAARLSACLRFMVPEMTFSSSYYVVLNYMVISGK
jgi:hypothetical protein